MDPGSEASQGDKIGRDLPTRSDVPMCLSMIVSWIAMHTGVHVSYRFNMSAPTTPRVGGN